ncbi:hypothetical protein GCM10018790_58540 [Kitasatospora xanthocidica]|uniref:hypothetical protein n=1 Tax=Kitasatospora xanthocidica TaxID=83382 RepID=UPI00167A9480|nr:hypothetical protein [Kitasatospora xanthocidica]GHF72936.1 hypothetical protein GCM10018790_58540 [Kitasatospora xanthocidica]
MNEGGTNDVVKQSSEGTGGAEASAGAEVNADGPQELSRTAAVVVTVLAALCGAAVLLAVFHWLGWGVPWIGWIVAKGGIKLAVGGFAGLAVGLSWLRSKLRARPKG